MFGLAAISILGVAVWLGLSSGGTQAALFGVGVGAGVVLYHASFGFASSWRALVSEGRGEGVRVQMLMLAVTSLVFIPVLAAGEWFGPVRGAVAPLGVSVVAGAFLFGVGMQLGGGCASGTLYTAGGGNIRMLAVLVAFIAGSVIGAQHQPFWADTPALPSVSLVERFGPIPALAFTLSACSAIALLSLAAERQRNGASDREPRAVSWLRGPWPLVAGALGLAVINIATLAITGRPWGITSAFVLWGSKPLLALGVDVASWPYWQPEARAAALRASVWADVTSVMNVGIVLGAFAAATVAKRLSPTWKVPLPSLAAAILGGLMLGYGARIAYGCNIGAFFSGIASSSLHGWLWMAAALAGTTLGTRIRPFFGLGASNQGGAR
ncbi:hypothetical protein BHS06_08360 [Myxococcus xanthus]|uniref:YeeE/YedE family protein n=1 Tax=Myxococcus xanthus TaxID=34 RepID=UPI001128A733|nr:YeeE/YedE family protein [Myxococcus xanthus]QDE88976.1 hypothetical protein BHS06_08360 [Myxococcus xanthus]